MSPSSASPEPTIVFISYAREDTALCRDLVTHLSSLKQQKFISAWHDSMIGAGDEWEGHIHEFLDKAGIILLLISPDFIGSDYINNVEVKRAMERHEAREARVIPIILRPSDWQGGPFGKLQALPTNATPVTLWHNSDEAYLNIVRGIREAIGNTDNTGRNVIKVPSARPVTSPDRREAESGDYAIPVNKEFDPEKFIDREFEQELFEKLLGFDTSARILAIKDRGGTGKSQLLERLRYRCRTVKPRTPVSLIALDQLPDDSPLLFTRRVSHQLANSGISFDTYTKLERARAGGHFVPFAIAGSSCHEIANVITTPTGLSEDQDRIAQEEVIRAFFDDLQEYCFEHPVVIILDSYERCRDALRTWIEEYFLEQYFFTQPASRLILVLAGQENPKFHSRWSREDCDSVVRSVNKLGVWTKEHVEECLEAHGFNYMSEHIDVIYGFIQTMNAPLSAVVQLMQTYLGNKDQRR